MRGYGRWTPDGRTLDTQRTLDIGRTLATWSGQGGHLDILDTTTPDGEPCCCGRHTRHSASMTAWR